MSPEPRGGGLCNPPCVCPTFFRGKQTPSSVAHVSLRPVEGPVPVAQPRRIAPRLPHLSRKKSVWAMCACGPHTATFFNHMCFTAHILFCFTGAFCKCDFVQKSFISDIYDLVERHADNVFLFLT